MPRPDLPEQEGPVLTSATLARLAHVRQAKASASGGYVPPLAYPGDGVDPVWCGHDGWRCRRCGAERPYAAGVGGPDGGLDGLHLWFSVHENGRCEATQKQGVTE